MNKKSRKAELRALRIKVALLEELVNRNLVVKYAGERMLNISLWSAGYFLKYTGTDEVLRVLDREGDELLITLSRPEPFLIGTSHRD